MRVMMRVARRVVMLSKTLDKIAGLPVVRKKARVAGVARACVALMGGMARVAVAMALLAALEQVMFVCRSQTQPIRLQAQLPVPAPAPPQVPPQASRPDPLPALQSTQLPVPPPTQRLTMRTRETARRTTRVTMRGV